MTTIDRRSFLASLTAATACTGVAPSLARSAIAAPTNEHRFIHSDKITFADDSDKLKEWWCMIWRGEPQETPTVAEMPAVDFWSRQYSDIDYDAHLPSEIRKTLLFYESCDRKDFNNETAFSYLDTLPQRYGINSSPDETLHWSVGWHRKYLSGSFRAHAGNPSPEELRTALIALDSIGPSPTEPEWAEYLSLFTQPHRSYGHIIGHIHAPGRGLRELKARLNCIERDNEKSYFERSVWDAASHCDVVIVTSSSLIESDLGLCTSSSTEMLAGELVRRFGYAILDRTVFHEIISSKDDHAKREPRFFALASATVDASNWYCLQVVHEILNRQRRLVSGSFGELTLDGTPIVVAITTRDRQLKEHGIYVDRKSFFEVRVPNYQSKHIGLAGNDHLILIALWPFTFDAIEGQDRETMLSIVSSL